MMYVRISRPAMMERGESINGRMIWELLGPLTVVYTTEDQRVFLRLTVPKGFRTDLASVPNFMHWLIRPSGDHQRAAIVHDFLYSEPIGISRVTADAILRDLCVHLGVPAWRRILMHWAVRLFGGQFWRGNR